MTSANRVIWEEDNAGTVDTLSLTYSHTVKIHTAPAQDLRYKLDR